MPTSRVAALYDIHGNLPALQAVLEEVRRLDVDVILFGGDLAWGPMPTETVNCITELENRSVFIRGNADREVAERYGQAQGLEPWVAEVNLWCADQLTDEQRTFLSRLQDTAVIDVDGLGPTLFCHGSPRSDEETITPATPEEHVREMVAAVGEPVVVCGHTHMQFDRAGAGKRIVNAGSVGMPYEGQTGAFWALLGPDLELKRTLYDVEDAAELVAESGCPHAAEFARDILEPPTRNEAIAAFTALEQRCLAIP